jgi:hypothetical protein
MVSLAVTPGSTMDFRNAKSSPKMVFSSFTGESTCSAAEVNSMSPASLWNLTRISPSALPIPPS